jgi:hypothetical protein
MLQHVGPRHDPARARRGLRIIADAGEPPLDVERIGQLARLAVAGDVDAGGDLLRHEILDGRGDQRVEGGAVIAPPVRPRPQQREQCRRPRQAADMGRQDTVGAELHGGASGIRRRE